MRTNEKPVKTSRDRGLNLTVTEDQVQTGFLTITGTLLTDFYVFLYLLFASKLSISGLICSVDTVTNTPILSYKELKHHILVYNNSWNCLIVF